MRGFNWLGAVTVASLVSFLGAVSCGSSNGSAFDGGLEGGGGRDATTDGGLHLGNDGGADDVGQVTCEAGCPMGTACNRGVCEPPQPDCVSNSGCEDDSYCLGNKCVPYGSLPDPKTNDPSCASVAPSGVFAPKVFCEFATAPAKDPFPQHLDVQATPIVVNFDGSGGIPSIIAPFTANVPDSYTETLGIVRILSGKDCSLVANLGGVDLNGDGVIDWVNSSSAVAVGDLNGDGVAEIVVYMANYTTVAFTRNKAKAWVPLWPKVFATLADGVTPFVSSGDGLDQQPVGGSTTGVWSAPSIHDLDNDGVPEIIREASVIEGNTGKLRAVAPADYGSYSVGIPPVLGDLYGDGNVELTNGANVWQFDGKTNAWVDVTTYSQTVSSPAGWTAIADMNPYDGVHQPEIAVASGGVLTIYSLDHSVFMNMAVTVPGGGGGPPTIADFDNDGLPEVGLAGADSYTVFDPDCQATPRTGGKCASRDHCDFFGGTCPDYILWTRTTQDHSSNITGSSVFDFAGNGHPQALYADECFARAFSGLDGTVLFSQYHSSCTWIENPVVADVDGDFRAEFVVGSNLACGEPPAGIPCVQLDVNGVDADFPGAACESNADCSSNKCDKGLCRCAATSDCCPAASDAACLEAGYQCAPPPMGTAGTGNTCRAPHPHGLQGIRVYKDAKDRWVRSREIWNQHAYAVTNVNDDGTIPKTSDWAENWTTAGLNNFRQNVPGTPDGKAIGDLTAKAGKYYVCTGSGAVKFEEPICNRGTAPIGTGVPVGFYVGTMKVCSAVTSKPLNVGDCETVSCSWDSAPKSMATEVNVTVVANDGDTKAECDTANDKGLIEDVFCMVTGPK
jgi:hypothetical protein